LANQLEKALDGRVVVEQPKGVLMAREGIGFRQAFELLRNQARRSRPRLSVVTGEVVNEAHEGEGIEITAEGIRVAPARSYPKHPVPYALPDGFKRLRRRVATVGGRGRLAPEAWWCFSILAVAVFARAVDDQPVPGLRSRRWRLTAWAERCSRWRPP
jgi:hypothetical protein